MLTRTFKKGIHPPTRKAATNRRPVETIMPAEGSVLTYPMLQHIGAECKPIVSVGDRILLGQKIGEAASELSSPVHSAVSGIVKKIAPSLTPSGIKINSVMIENDGLMTEHESIKINADYFYFSRNEYINIIKEAGIVGLGGAGFPTHYKLNQPPGKKVDYIIVNAAECEPYLTNDHRALLEEPEKVRTGLKIILGIFPGAKGIIAIETNKTDGIKKMKEICKGDKNIKIIPLLTKYPQGSEKQLIYSCTGRKVPSMGLPVDIGVIVNNIDTVVAIHRAVVRGRPLMRKVITVSGGAVNNPGNYKVRLGMSHRELMEQIGGFKEEPYKIIFGGPMMGTAVFDLDAPVIKTSSAILCLTKKEAHTPPEKNCIRCSKCVQHCPANLLPLDLNQYALRGEMDLFEKYHGLDCIECGSCSYICPAKRHLAQSIITSRKVLLEEKRLAAQLRRVTHG